MKAETIEVWLRGWIARNAGMAEEEIDSRAEFTAHGLDSLKLFTLSGDIAEWLDRNLEVGLLWERPTIRSLAEYLAESAGGKRAPEISAAPRCKPIRLSFGQERFWRFAEKTGDLNLISRRYVLEGPLDIRAMERAVDELFLRHESLRTRFEEIGGEPYQIILPARAGNLSFSDLSGEECPGEEAERRLREEALRGINLETGPLLRMLLMRHHESGHSFGMILHHLAFDAHAANILKLELGLIYDAFRAGAESPLGKPERQMADFAAWQREWLRKDGEQYRESLAWWRNHWSGLAAGDVILPYQWNEKPAVPDILQSSQNLTFAPELPDRLRAVCRAENVTLYMLMFAAFAWLLRKRSGNQELAIGTYTAGRTDPGIADAMGCFVNLLVLRAEFGDRPDFRTVLGRIRESILGAHEHQHLPFEELKKSMNDEGRESPAVQIIFQQVKPAIVPQFAGLEVSEGPENFRTYQMPWGLSLSVVEWPHKIMAIVGYDSGLYEPAKMNRMLKEYEALLAEIAAEFGEGSEKKLLCGAMPA